MLLCTNKGRRQNRTGSARNLGDRRCMGAVAMPEHFFHRFAIEVAGRRVPIALHQEQMDAILSGERRVVEGMPQRIANETAFVWWYFNDTGLGLLHVEMGSDPDHAAVVWEGRLHDAYVGRLCSVLTL